MKRAPEDEMLALLTCKSDGENRIAVTMARASVKRQIVGNRLAECMRGSAECSPAFSVCGKCIWDRCCIQSVRHPTSGPLERVPGEGPGTHPKLELT